MHQLLLHCLEALLRPDLAEQLLRLVLFAHCAVGDDELVVLIQRSIPELAKLRLQREGIRVGTL